MNGSSNVSIYGFAQDNTKRPTVQVDAFRSACVALASEIVLRGAALLMVGNERSSQFPNELRPFRTRRGSGIKVNLLVNYHWDPMGLERSLPEERQSLCQALSCI